MLFCGCCFCSLRYYYIYYYLFFGLFIFKHCISISCVFYCIVRVRHMKGLLDAPICCVEDQVEPRYLLSPPTGQDFGTPFRPKGSTRYSANVNKGIPAVGVGTSHLIG